MGDLPIIGDVGELGVVGDDVAIETREKGFAKIDVGIDEDAVFLRVMGEVEVGFKLALVICDDGVARFSLGEVVDLLSDLPVEVADAVGSGKEKEGAWRDRGPALEWFGSGHGETEVADL